MNYTIVVFVNGLEFRLSESSVKMKKLDQELLEVFAK